MAPSGNPRNNKRSSVNRKTDFKDSRSKYSKPSDSSGGVNKKGSLKHQLRGQQRLLGKLLSTTPSDQQTTDEFLNRKSVLENKIRTIERQMEQTRLRETERKNAVRYHKVKFFERQKLTRMERRILRELQEAKETNDVVQVNQLKEELKQVKLDRQYVRYFPNDTKYLSLFPDGVYYKTLETMDEEVEAKRAAIRERVAAIVAAGGDSGEKSEEDIKDVKSSGDEPAVKNVVSKQQVASKTVSSDTASKVKGHKLEKQVVIAKPQASLDNTTPVKVAKPMNRNVRTTSDDDRVDVEQIEEAAPVGVEKDDTSSEDNDSSSSSDDDSSSSTTSSSSDDDDDSVMEEEHLVAVKGEAAVSIPEAAESESENDDFFVDQEAVDPKSAFKNATTYLEGTGSAHGDKSKGWATQKQRPGEFKRRRERR